MILDGNTLAQRLIADLREDATEASQRGVRPGFGVVLVGNDPASHLYVSMKMRLARSLGFASKRVLLQQSATESEVIAKLRDLQSDPHIHGVIIQIPLPTHLDASRICMAIDPAKDIDCLHPDNLKKLTTHRKPFFWPPTAESVVYLIRSVKMPLIGKRVAVVGRGFFARQIGALLKAKKTHVLFVTSATPKKRAILQAADIIVSAVGKPGIITGEDIKKGVVVIDVGVAKSGSKTVGDVDMKSVLPKARAVSPVPGGVGPVTVVMLMRNVLKAALALTK